MINETTTGIALQKDMHFVGTSETGLKIDMDSKPAGVQHEGLTPMELVLQALGGCTGMDIAFILRKMKLEPEQLEVKVKGIKREEYPRIWTHINLTYRVKGDGITLRDLERAADLSQNKYCSVSAMLKEAVEISYKCELID